MHAPPEQELASVLTVEHARDRAELPQQYESWQDYAFSDARPEEPVPGS